MLKQSLFYRYEDPNESGNSFDVLDANQRGSTKRGTKNIEHHNSTLKMIKLLQIIFNS